MARIVISLLVVVVVSVGVWLFIVLGPKRDASAPAADAASTVISKGGSGAADAGAGIRSTFDPDKELQANELLVVNPPANFNDVVRKLNFTVIERFTFQGLGFGVARLRIPPDMPLAQSRGQLGAELPGVRIDFNHRYDASQGRPGQTGGSAADQLKKKKRRSPASRKPLSGGATCRRPAARDSASA